VKILMADTNVIGNASDYTVYFGDEAAGSSVYAVYIKPEQIRMYITTPASIEKNLELDNSIIKQIGKQAIIFKMRNIIIDTFAEFENFKEALNYWASSNGGAGTFGGMLLTFQAKDVNGNEWSKASTYDTPEALETITIKIIRPVEIIPLPCGKYKILNLEVIRAKEITDVSDE